MFNIANSYAHEKIESTNKKNEYLDQQLKAIILKDFNYEKESNKENREMKNE